MTKLTAPDLDALIEQIRTFLADAPKGKPHEGYRYGELLSQAAAALVQLRDALRDMTADRDSWEQQNDDRVSDVLEQANRAERAEAEVARLTETTTHITWDAQGCRLVNGRLGHEHSAPTVNVQLSGDAEYWKDRAERAESRANELEQARESIEEFSHMKTDRIAALEAERGELKQDALRYRWLREKLVYQKSGPHYGWTLDELIPGDERDAAIDAAKEKP